MLCIVTHRRIRVKRPISLDEMRPLLLSLPRQPLEDHLRPYFLHVDDLIMPLTDDPSGLLMHSQILLARRPLLFPDITNDACSLNT
jgi:hypothetical protein